MKDPPIPTNKDLQALLNKQMLSDYVINFMFNEISLTNSNYYCIDSLYTAHIKAYGFKLSYPIVGYEENFGKKKSIVLPVHSLNHWSVLVYNVCKNEIYYYDSMFNKSKRTEYEKTMDDFENCIRFNLTLNDCLVKELATRHIAYENVRQNDHTSCGIYAFLFAQLLCAEEFNEKNTEIKKFNHSMVEEIRVEIANLIKSKMKEKKTSAPIIPKRKKGRESDLEEDIAKQKIKDITGADMSLTTIAVHLENRDLSGELFRLAIIPENVKIFGKSTSHFSRKVLSSLEHSQEKTCENKRISILMSTLTSILVNSIPDNDDEEN